MSILHAIILGIIQGTGEFLPISSSGHLVVIPYLFGWDYQGLNFDIALHMGTVLALIIFFWQDWGLIIANGILVSTSKKPSGKFQPNLLWIILLGSVPAAIAGYYLEGLAEHALRNPLLVAILLAIFGIVLWIVDYANSGKQKVENLGYLKGLLIGIGQAIAIFPGVSRSGSTTTVGLLLNLDRESATRFSFLLAAPVMLGAFALSLKSFDHSMISVPFMVAILTSAAFGLLSIRFLLRFLNKHGFGWFAIYRLALATLIIVVYYTR